MIVAVIVFTLMGCVFALKLAGHLDEPDRWIGFLSLVIGVGLWTRQNWARWLGMLWCMVYVVNGIVKMRSVAVGNDALLSRAIACLLLLALTAILFKYSFNEKTASDSDSSAANA